MRIKRQKCVLCNSKLREFHRINSMPVYMGVVDSNENVIRDEMIFVECLSCGLIQNGNLIDLSLVYQNNHNTQIVGGIWDQHYVELANFIRDNSIGDIILEIGDPSMKIASKISKNYKKWIIIEPNIVIEPHDNIEIYRSYFDGKNPTAYKISTIVHSHLFEHIYEPLNFLKNCFEILEDDSNIIFSIPNMKWLIENKSLPTSILHFEHTFYVNIDNIEFFLNISGFRLCEIKQYKNHSLFIKASKNKNFNKIVPIKKFCDKDKFLSLVEYYKNKIIEINLILENQDYYLYSAHINSQYLLNNNISANIKGILDSSISKIGKKLYGHEYNIYEPNKISNEENPIVVVSHMGVYFEEIKGSLLGINKNTIIL